ncbi:hypothetical protein E4T56_gene5566 [Termitomyces sp. T112]|nr:hypothetical protein E4T56_gene5566 [Termitomyces sp. T112]
MILGPPHCATDALPATAPSSPLSAPTAAGDLQASAPTYPGLMLAPWMPRLLKPGLEDSKPAPAPLQIPPASHAPVEPSPSLEQHKQFPPPDWASQNAPEQQELNDQQLPTPSYVQNPQGNPLLLRTTLPSLFSNYRARKKNTSHSQ